MAVAYRTRHDRSDPAASDDRVRRATQEFRRSCNYCGTTVTTSVDAAGLVIDVAGRTCPRCNAGFPADGADANDQISTASGRDGELWWALTGPGSYCWRLLVVDRGRPDGTVIERAPGRRVAEAAFAVDPAWADLVAGKLSDRLGSIWDVIQAGWDVRHCDLLTTLGDLFDELWCHLVPGAMETRLVLRLAGLPFAVAALLIEALGRSGASEAHRFTEGADRLRELGPVVCLGTKGHLACGAVQRELGALSAKPTTGAWAASSASRTIRALEGGFDLKAIHDERSDRGTRKKAEDPEPEPEPEARDRRSGLENALDAIRAAPNAPESPMTFGTR